MMLCIWDCDTLYLELWYCVSGTMIVCIWVWDYDNVYLELWYCVFGHDIVYQKLCYCTSGGLTQYFLTCGLFVVMIQVIWSYYSVYQELWLEYHLRWQINDFSSFLQKLSAWKVKTHIIGQKKKENYFRCCQLLFKYSKLHRQEIKFINTSIPTDRPEVCYTADWGPVTGPVLIFLNNDNFINFSGSNISSYLNYFNHKLSQYWETRPVQLG